MMGCLQFDTLLRSRFNFEGERVLFTFENITNKVVGIMIIRVHVLTVLIKVVA